MARIYLCPKCGGDLSLVEREGRIVGAECEACGYFTGVAGYQGRLFEPRDLAPQETLLD